MVKKSKGRQKIEMVKMKNESNLQVTFSKRRSGLFKKASELCTLCGVEMAIIVFSPGRKVFSFGHPNVETIIDRFLNDNLSSLPHQHNPMQLTETHRNANVQNLNNHLTQVLSQLELEKKRYEELKKIRENCKNPEHWWEEPIEKLSLNQAKEFKGILEDLKKVVTLEASKLFQERVSHQNFYVGSSSNPLFGFDGGNNTNSDLDQLNQRGMMTNMNTFYNQDFILPTPALPFGNNPTPALLFGNNNHNNNYEESVSDYNMNYRSRYSQNQNQNETPSFKRENDSEYEHHHGHP